MIRTLGLIFLALLVVVPLGWVVLASLKTSHEIVASPWGLPAQPQWANYATAWREAGIGNYFVNSVIVTVLTLAILLPMGAMAAYVLAKFPFRGSRTIFGAFLGGMIFPNLLVIVPLFVLLSHMKLLDTKTGLVAVYVEQSDGGMRGAQTAAWAALLVAALLAVQTVVLRRKYPGGLLTNPARAPG